MTIPFDINQAGWGSSELYPDDPAFDPKYVVVHWGGGTDQIVGHDEPRRLRIWQSYHISSRGMSDIAYNYAVGDSGLIYRCRGLNPGGHTKSSDRTPGGDRINEASIGVVWIGGAADPDGPSQAARDSMQRLCDAAGVPVVTHREAKEWNGSSTECPGNDWAAWVADYEPEVGMPREQWHQLIDALFRGRPDKFQGDPNYWKFDVPADSPEWGDFFDAFVAAISVE